MLAYNEMAHLKIKNIQIGFDNINWLEMKREAIIAKIDKSISHHTARKTFASTVLLYNDVPM